VFSDEYARPDENGTPNELIARSLSLRVKPPVPVFTPSARTAWLASVMPSAAEHPQPAACRSGIAGGSTVVRGWAFSEFAEDTSPSG
jgi:hypothetical protein